MPRETTASFGRGLPIIFLHGWQLNKELEIQDFEPVFRGRSGWRRIYTDLPGMGARRGEGDSLRNFNDLRDWALEFVDAETNGGAFAIAGTSVGAQLARGVVEKRGERALGLLLRVPRLVANRKSRSIYDSDGPDLTEMTRAQRDIYLDRDDIGAAMPARFKTETKERYAQWVKARRRSNTRVMERIEEDYELKPRPKRVFDKPTLIVVGRQDSRVGFLEALGTKRTRRVGVALHEQYPRATIAALDRAGHALPVGSPDLFRALVRDWLDRMEEVTPKQS